MESHRNEALLTSGAKPVEALNLSGRQCAGGPWQRVGDWCAMIAASASRDPAGGQRCMGSGLIDSTSIRLSSLSKDWATFGDVYWAQGAYRYDQDDDRHVYFAVGDGYEANVNDTRKIKRCRFRGTGATYAFDLGYYDYGLEGGTRLMRLPLSDAIEKNTPLDRDAREQRSKDSKILK